MKGADSINIMAVVDNKGQILEKIAVSWKNYAKPNIKTIVYTQPHTLNGIYENISLYDISVIVWLDIYAFTKYSRYINIPQISMIHHWTEAQLPSIRKSITFADALITAAEYWKNQLVKIGGESIFLIPYTLDDLLYGANASNIRRSLSKEAVGISNDVFVIGFVGKESSNYDDRKGILLLESILRKLQEQHVRYEVLIIGTGWEKFSTKLGTVGIKVKVYPINHVDDAPQYYGAMDLLLITSSIEGGPYPLMEAMASKVLVVSSPVGHVPDIIENGENGYICNERLADEYVSAIINVINEPQLAQLIKDNAFKYIISKRMNSVVLPQIDFNMIYLKGIENFHNRPWKNKITRRILSLMGLFFCRMKRRI